MRSPNIGNKNKINKGHKIYLAKNCKRPVAWSALNHESITFSVGFMLNSKLLLSSSRSLYKMCDLYLCPRGFFSLGFALKKEQQKSFATSSPMKTIKKKEENKRNGTHAWRGITDSIDTLARLRDRAQWTGSRNNNNSNKNDKHLYFFRIDRWVAPLLYMDR